MEQRIDFLAPKLTGERFDSHTLPVSLLEDFSALEELIFDVAKQIYLDEHPSRKKVPKGFNENITLSISGIEEGSTIPKLVLISALTNTITFAEPPPGPWVYIEKARDRVIEAISNANQNKGAILEDKYISYFNRIGKNLRKGESIDFLPKSNKKAILTQNVRNRILLSKDEKHETYEACLLYASIPSVDKKEGIFKLDIDGNAIECSLNDFARFYDNILDGFNKYEKNALVFIKAIGVYNEQKKLVGIHGMESMEVLDPYDVGARLHYLSKLTDNWFDVHSKAPKHAFLDSFGRYFNLHFDKELPLPSIFPTVEGNIQLEWTFDTAAVILEVDHNYVSDLLIAYHAGEIVEMKLNLSEKAGWELLNNNIKGLK